MQAHGDRRSSGRAHRGQKELALVGAARLLHRLVLHGAALGRLVLVRSLRLRAILVHVLVLDGRRAAALLPHLLPPDVVVHAALLGHASLVHHLVGKRLSHLAVPRQLRSPLLLDGHGARRGPWRRLVALRLARVLLASTGWYK